MRERVSAVRVADNITVRRNGETWRLQLPDPIAAAAEEDDAGGRLVAPIPGQVTQVMAQPGMAVVRGQVMVVLEAMKTVFRLTAPADGIVATVSCQAGDSVVEGQLLVGFAEGDFPPRRNDGCCVNWRGMVTVGGRRKAAVERACGYPVGRTGNSMTGRKAYLAAALLAVAVTTGATAADTPGVTATEIKIGNTVPYSGPASSYSVLGKLESAFFGMVNEQGGVAGHKINFISLDDNYSPPKTVEQIRRLVEEEEVAFTFGTLGTPTNSAIVHYMNQKKVPHLFVSTGADKWGDYKQTPWTIGWQPSYRTEAQIYTKYILQQKPNAKIAILYQNDDFGKDYPNGVKDVLGDKFDKMVVTATYETTDPTIDSQITSLQASGADVLLVAAIPKFAAQAIRKVHDLNWKPMFFMSNVSISVGAVMTPAGPGERHWHHQRRVSEGFVRSDLEGRSGHERVARVHEQAHAGRRPDGRRLHCGIRSVQDDAAGAAAGERRLLARPTS